MRPAHTFLAVLATLLTSFAGASEIRVYVSESGDKRIAVYTLDEATGDLTRNGAMDLPGAPGSLAVSQDQRHLYAAVRSTRQFASLAIDPATGLLAEPVLTPPGINAAYVHVDKTGRWLLAASYSEGMVSLSKITQGVIDGAPVLTMETGKKAHSIQTDAANRFAFVPHVGELNKVEQLRFDAAAGTLRPNTPPALPGGEGEGPRHMQFHPNGRWAYFVNEQGKSVTLCDYNAETGTLKSRQSVSTIPADWDKTKGSCADIHVSADGRFVYASNRGHDSLAVFSIHPETGELTSHGQTPTEKTPRSFCLVPGGENYVISAGEGSNRLIVFRRDAKTGALTPLKTYDCGKGPAWVTAVKFD
ncbi:lactonase family protein [Prosthecobacter sp. SYSU 5D2]|uniref:lactonase family protein n=1 Tax=Prosthecobacter sp. SYSU 5D2 TaxID=3134134 RepID=UPI0031FF0DEE